MINRNRLVQTFLDLVQIDSPSYFEDEICEDLKKRLRSLDLEVETDNYGNIIAGDGGENPLLLSAHMDTVDPGRGVKPTVDGDRIVTDGTTILGGDCKAGISAILEGIQSIREDSTKHFPIEVCFTRAEETGLDGAGNLDYSKITSKESIVFDGEGPASTITNAAPTYIGFSIKIKGRAAHAGFDPENGISAIRIASEFITRLPQGRLDGETTFNVGTIEGGTVRNAVPESTTVVGEFRSINTETLDDVQQQVDVSLDQVRRMFPEASLEPEFTTEFKNYRVGDDNPMMVRIKKAVRSLGMEPTVKSTGGGSDANVFRQKGINAVVVGMADHNMHTVREFVTIPDLVDAAHLCEAMLRND
tara:strand:+ start:5646 stop:6725 length:1080 start_codon:yes stop_codon:yes gene_type:complete